MDLEDPASLVAIAVELLAEESSAWNARLAAAPHPTN